MKQLILLILVISAFLPNRYNIWYKIGKISTKFWKDKFWKKYD